MTSFREQVGDETFKAANNDYNRAYNIWLEEVKKDPRYQALTQDGKMKLQSEAKEAIKKKILKEYGYKKPKKVKKTEEEKQDAKSIEKLKP